jgi:DNA replication protein DnaC
LAKGLIGCDNQIVTCVAMGNKFKEKLGFSVAFFDVADIVNDQKKR